MRNRSLADLLTHQTRESLAIRMESFADAFERLASTANQFAQADSYGQAVHKVAKVPLTAAELPSLAAWLKSNCDKFEQTATTTEQKEQVAAFKEFIAEVSGPAVSDAFQRPLVNALVEDIQSALADGHRNGFPLAWLSDEDKRDYLATVIDWTDYINRGLDLGPDTAAHIDRIIDNAVSGKPAENWMGRTDQAADKFEEMLNRQPDQPANVQGKGKHRDLER